MTFIQPGEPSPKKNPYAREDRAYEEAKADRAARRSKDKARSWERALGQVKTWTPSMAVEAMNRMPQAVQQMYLLAEEASFNRNEVTRFFPAVAPSTRAAWAGFATPEAAKAAPKPRQRKAS